MLNRAHAEERGGARITGTSSRIGPCVCELACATALVTKPHPHPPKKNTIPRAPFPT